MSTIFTVSAITVYAFFNVSLEKDENERLKTLTQAASPSIKTIKTKGVVALEKDLSWRNLLEKDQGIEWFDADGKLLAKEGSIFFNYPLSPNIATRNLNQDSPLTQKKGNIRSVSIPIYTYVSETTLNLEGYIRASESNQELATKLNRLQLGLKIGGLTVLILSSVSGGLLTFMVIKPIKQSFHYLKQFTADASHELRNPLTAIKTSVELMQSRAENLSNDDARKIAIISSATEQIKRLVEDLRFLSQTDAMPHNSPLEYPQIPLDEILEDLADSFETQAACKQLDFESRLSDSVLVKGDMHQLKRLFTNLLENSIKYTKTGGIVKLYLEKRKNFALVRVEDNGIGIPQEYIPLIFQRFWRTDTAHHQDTEGLGLGLAIVQAIVQKHRGRINVKSQVGVGSSFQVYLPLA
ncbi:HAMP domain-containing histidine kinase [Plectonema cf. radiosum LEGE 06105]|uniref:histidine kinase n=1 Tax=Plectonema cf. radiosum LEGE 06105 TaxID=945769 RepID=A0A8J7F8Q0_9CYAN|nr:HAMP domain-containing sensor histidine kinase [Plectonema radiosum]MBE9216632.1 HAMP domain-containing histidine kinase [Plectonema cf. radiosum LEGE 06105]